LTDRQTSLSPQVAEPFDLFLEKGNSSYLNCVLDEKRLSSRLRHSNGKEETQERRRSLDQDENPKRKD
jgi:hypothetical protein